MAGLQHTDHGEEWAFDDNNDRFRAYVDSYEWKNGIVVKDWRYGVRQANIDISDLTSLTGTQALSSATSIIKLMAKQIARLPGRAGKECFYVNRTVASNLMIIGLEKSSAAVTVEPGLTQFGKEISMLKFLGIPVRTVDQLLETEARVV